MSRFRTTGKKKASFDDFVEIVVSAILLILVVGLAFGLTANLVNSKVAKARAGLEKMEGDYLLVEYLKSPVNEQSSSAKTISCLIEESYAKDGYRLLETKTNEFFDSSFLKSRSKEWAIEIREMPDDKVKARMGCIDIKCIGLGNVRDKRIISE